MLWLVVRVFTGISNLISGRSEDKAAEALYGKEVWRAFKRELERAWTEKSLREADETYRRRVILYRLRMKGFDTTELEAALLPEQQGGRT